MSLPFLNLTPAAPVSQLTHQILHADPRILSGGPASRPTEEQQHTGAALLEADPNMDVRWQVLRGELEGLGGSEAMFWHLFGGQGAEDTFWLDRLGDCC